MCVSAHARCHKILCTIQLKLIDICTKRILQCIVLQGYLVSHNTMDDKNED